MLLCQLTPRCGSAFRACPTNQAIFLICYLIELGGCHLQQDLEKPSTSSSGHRKSKYQNALWIVTQNHFPSIIPPKYEDADQTGLHGKFKLLESAIHSAQSPIPPLNHRDLQQLTPGMLEKGKTGTESSTTDGATSVCEGTQL